MYSLRRHALIGFIALLQTTEQLKVWLDLFVHELWTRCSAAGYSNKPCFRQLSLLSSSASWGVHQAQICSHNDPTWPRRGTCCVLLIAQTFFWCIRLCVPYRCFRTSVGRGVHTFNTRRWWTCCCCKWESLPQESAGALLKAVSGKARQWFQDSTMIQQVVAQWR